MSGEKAVIIKDAYNFTLVEATVVIPNCAVECAQNLINLGAESVSRRHVCSNRRVITGSRTPRRRDRRVRISIYDIRETVGTGHVGICRLTASN